MEELDVPEVFHCSNDTHSSTIDEHVDAPEFINTFFDECLMSG